MNPALDLQANNIPSNGGKKESPTSQAIVALPVSFKLPNDNTILASSSPEKKRITAETPEGWICEARTRKNGVVDKFYYHQLTNVRCRSLKEVERYDLHGIRPGPRAKEKEMEIIVATAEKKAKKKEEICQGTQNPETGVVPRGKNKRKSNIHIPPKVNGHRQVLMEKILAEAWHNMMNHQDIRTEAWEEFEAMEKQEAVADAIETWLQEERDKLVRKFTEERQELEKKFEEERAQLHKWMKDEIEYRIQLHWDSIMPGFLQGRSITPPPPPPPSGGDSTGI